jgi:NAD-dependent dihydropyrimidine dehydrogenase PreA subunit
VPVIARVNGFALGGGFEMVLGCDIVVACEEASFGLPEPLVGRMPLDGGMTLLQRQVPFRKAMAMLFTGKRVSAAQALDMGLVNEVVPRAELDATVRAGCRTSWPARRCRSRRSSRWCGPPADEPGAGPGRPAAGAGGRAELGGRQRRRARVPGKAQAAVERPLSGTAQERPAMAYVIIDTCIDCKDASCVACCPVDCIYEGPRTFYIHPDECINCGICVSVCPPEAIYEDAEVPAPSQQFIAINREFFSDPGNRAGQPGGVPAASARRCVDHPRIHAHTARAPFQRRLAREGGHAGLGHRIEAGGRLRALGGDRRDVDDRAPRWPAGAAARPATGAPSPSG